MDRRTILFVLLVTLSFFGLNLYFSRDRDQKNRELLARQEIENKKRTQQEVELVKSKSVSLNQLPIVEIYADASSKEPLFKGINVQGNTLTLAWDKQLPQSVWVGGQKQELMTTKDYVVESPVVYGKKDFESLQIASLPTVGTYDLQLLLFHPHDRTLSVRYAQYEEGDIRILGEPIKSNAIALHKGDNGYLPLGFFEWRGSLFIELQKLPLLTEITSKQKIADYNPNAEIENEEKFYVLENGYTQLVLSNKGAALVEINLPLSNQSDVSVVNEIGFDRDIVRINPENGRFPLRPYFSATDPKKLLEGKVGGYYPLLRRSIVGKKGFEVKPQNYGLNIVSEYPEMAELVFTVKEFTQNRITFEALQPHRRITKSYTLKSTDQAAPYVFDVEITIDGDRRGLALTSGITEVEIMSNNSNPQIMYRLIRKQKSDVQKLSLPRANETVSVGSISPDWIVTSNGYLGVILDPLNEKATGFQARSIYGGQSPTRLTLIDPRFEPFPASKYPGFQMQLPLSAMAKKIDVRVYAGPFEEKTLKSVDKIFTDPVTGQSPDYIACKTFHGWFSFISEPFARLLFVVMRFFYNITGSWGFSIILLTIFLRVLLYPLNGWSIKSMRRMQEIAPQVKAIQQKYKKDPKKSQVEIMALYRNEKVNPFTGCLPILIQLPFLIAMFDLLKSSFQLRGASFIPGWIDNLTAPDVLFEWQRPLFFIGNQLHLLPFLLGAVMFIQQRISGPKRKVSELTDQERQQRAMGTLMTIVFTVMFYHFPSGLNLYWLSSMILGIIQQLITNKMIDKKNKKLLA